MLILLLYHTFHRCQEKTIHFCIFLPYSRKIKDLPIIDGKELLAYLVSRPSPVPETELLRRFYPEARKALIEVVSLDLFRYHFLLYHSLFRLAASLESSESEYYLHIKSINVYLFRKPAPEYCIHFDPDKPGFGGIRIDTAPAPASRYCSFHRRKADRETTDGTVGEAAMSSYYLNLENLDSMDDSRLRMWQEGIFAYAASYEEIDRCLELFGLSSDFSMKRLKNRYRYLSKLYHPDTSSAGGVSAGGDAPDLKDIRHAYRILSSLRPKMDEE